MSVRLRERRLSEQFLSKPRCIKLAYDSFTEEENAGHEDDAGYDCDGEVGGCEIVLKSDHEGCTDDWSNQRSDAAKQCHQDHLARHLPGHVGQRGELQQLIKETAAKYKSEEPDAE